MKQIGIKRPAGRGRAAGAAFPGEGKPSRGWKTAIHSAPVRRLLACACCLAGSFLLLVSVMVCMGSLISDILLALIDPRIRFGAGVE